MSAKYPIPPPANQTKPEPPPAPPRKRDDVPFADVAPGVSTMTLRDYFAGQALAGLMANYNSLQGIVKRAGTVDTRSIAAAIALDVYVMADAMIEEREK